MQSYSEYIFSDINTALRIEWCRARVRAHRWQEECLLLAEEMRRIKQYFANRQEWWQNLAANPIMIAKDNANISEVSPELNAIHLKEDQHILDGKRAYALRQADIQERMSSACETEWLGLPEKLITMKGRDARVMVEHV